MSKKVVVTGGAGFIGSHLVNLLLTKGYDVTVYDNFSNGSGKLNLSSEAIIVKGDILNYNKMKSVFKTSDMIFNLAVLPLTMSFDEPEKIIRTNDFGTYYVSKICSELNLKLVHVSSSEVYGSAKSFTMKEDHQLFPTTIYASSKVAGEAYVRAFGKSHNLKYVIVRPFNSYGEFMREDTYAAAIPKFYSRLSKNKNIIIFGSGNQTRDLTHVEDTARGIFLAGTKSKAVGMTFNISQGKETSVNKLAKITIQKYNELTGKNHKIKLIHTKERKGDVKRHLGNNSLAKSFLGYSPTIDLENGIAKYLKWKLK